MSETQTAIQPLTAIRGIAALWVFIYHCQFLTTGSAFFNELVKRGYLGVDIFFVLSGFIISYVHMRDFPTRNAIRANGPRFLLLRLARIYPLHLLTLLTIVFFLMTGIFGPNKTNTWENFIYNLFLIQSLPLSEKTSWNVVSWSISVEWLLYLLFPLLAWSIGNRAKDALSNLLWIALSLSLWMWYFAASRLDISYMHQPGWSIPRGLLDFMIGMALYNLYTLKFKARLPWDTLAMAGVMGFGIAIWLKSQRLPMHDVVFIILSAWMIYALAHVRGFSQKIFANRAVVYLGTISYSLYMWHWIYAIFIWAHVLRFFSERSFFTWEFIAMAAGLIAISALSYHLFESPARKWARRAMGYGRR